MYRFAGVLKGGEGTSSYVEDVWRIAFWVLSSRAEHVVLMAKSRQGIQDEVQLECYSKQGWQWVWWDIWQQQAFIERWRRGGELV
mmetsp:Transcript_62127/g.103237  ORF Transcript_62127/g.103237 Transcript_62127/m.103237 type:complete len:85 (-) Transcript_62127:848-1102(-)